MSERRQLGVQDALWLEMDRPTNLMVVDSLVWTANPIDWNRFRVIAKERLWERYRVFRSVAVRGDDDAWYWEEQLGDDFEAHFEHVQLSEPGDDAVLQELIGSQRTVPLDRDKPLWKMFLVDGYQDGSAIFIRSHHALADGIRMVQWAMSHPEVYRIWAVCDVDNVASARLLESVGMQLEGTLRRWLIHPTMSEQPRDCLCYAAVKGY